MNTEKSKQESTEQALNIPVVMPSSYMPYDLDLPNGLYKTFTDRNREGVAEMFYGNWMEYDFSPLPDEKVVGFKDY